MVSRRNFFSITLIMLVVVFMFQVPEVIKNQVNNYGENEYEEITDTGLTEKSVYTASETDVKDTGRFVVFIGDTEEGSVGSVVREWSFYTKRYMESYKSVKEYEPDPGNLPEAVLVDSKSLDMKKDISVLGSYTEKGIHIIFCNLPEVTEVSKNPKLRIF